MRRLMNNRWKHHDHTGEEWRSIGWWLAWFALCLLAGTVVAYW